NGALKERFGQIILNRLLLQAVPKRAVVGLPGIQAVRMPAADSLLFRLRHCWLNRTDDAGGDFVLDGKDVDEITVIALSPHMCAGTGFDELGGDANTRSGFSDAALKNVTHTKFMADLFGVGSTRLIGKTGVSSDDKQPTQF